MSWTSDDAIDRARDELARQAEAQHPGWKFSHGLFGWSATRDGKTLSASNMPGVMTQIAAAGSRRKPE